MANSVDIDNTSVLTLSDVGVCFDSVPVFEHVSYTLERAQMCCLSGPSGCGKSSLLKSVMGFVPFSGRIEVCGTFLNGNTAAEIRRNITYLPQDLSLPAETVRDLLHMPFLLRANRHIEWNESRLLEHWKMLGLDVSLLDARTCEISGGQRQRMMLAVSGILDKRLLLADEPTSALDPDSARRVLDYLHYLTAESGMSVLVVSHSPLFYESLPLLRLG